MSQLDREPGEYVLCIRFELLGLLTLQLSIYNETDLLQCKRERRTLSKQMACTSLKQIDPGNRRPEAQRLKQAAFTYM